MVWLASGFVFTGDSPERDCLWGQTRGPVPAAKALQLARKVPSTGHVCGRLSQTCPRPCIAMELFAAR